MVDTEGLSRRSAAKRAAILAAAREIFLHDGYAGTSMDEIAAAAEVSKMTVYKHFSDKRRLFGEIIGATIGQAESRSHEAMAALGSGENLAAELRRFARGHVRELLRPEVVRMRRVIIGEAERFPELAREWFDKAPERASETLGERFAEMGRIGLLRVPDPVLAAQHFHWLVVSVPLNKAMFYGESAGFGDAQLRRYADEAVRVFLAAYGK